MSLTATPMTVGIKDDTAICINSQGFVGVFNMASGSTGAGYISPVSSTDLSIKFAALPANTNPSFAWRFDAASSVVAGGVHVRIGNANVNPATATCPTTTTVPTYDLFRSID
jgi:hypothetical protein